MRQPGDLYNKAKAKADKERGMARAKVLQRIEAKQAKANLLNAQQFAKLQTKKKVSIMGLV